MKHKRSKTARKLQLMTIMAGFVFAISAPSNVTDGSVAHGRSLSKPVQLVSESMVESRPTAPSVTASVEELERAVRRAAQQHRLHPALLFAVMTAESSFNPIVVSKAGAVGLMQLVPETAMRHGVRNLYDTNENVAGGARHLRYLLDRFHGNTRLALAAYNAGERKVDRYKQIPPYKETQDYVKRVLVYYRSYKKDGCVMPVVVAAPSMHAGRPY